MTVQGSKVWVFAQGDTPHKQGLEVPFFALRATQGRLGSGVQGAKIKRWAHGTRHMARIEGGKDKERR